MIFRIYKNRDYEIIFNLSDEGAEVTLTGEEDIEFAVFTQLEKKIMMSKSLGDGMEVIDTDSGKIRLKFNPSDTNIDIGSYDYEFYMKDENGDEFTVLQGELFILPTYIERE